LNVAFRAPHITATLTGYAYETEANKAIDAGQTKENATSELLTPRSRKTQQISALGRAGARNQWATSTLAARGNLCEVRLIGIAANIPRGGEVRFLSKKENPAPTPPTPHYHTPPQTEQLLSFFGR